MNPGIGSYPSIYALGHRAISDIFVGPVLVQEKVDGSQFSFGIVEGKLCCRSKGAQIDMDAPGMFQLGVETVKALADKLTPERIYRGEFLSKPKHNTLAYDRTPHNNIIIFDVEDALRIQKWEDSEWVQAECERIGLEYVPVFAKRVFENWDEFKDLLNTKSVLGGANIEGVVAKNYDRYTHEKKVMMGKYVSEAFKEVHSGDWKARNPDQKGVLAMIISKLDSHARWYKAVQHLQEAGLITHTPADIGPLMKEVSQDILKEEEERIKDTLFKHFWKDISKGVTKGLPEWYKEQLGLAQFDDARGYAFTPDLPLDNVKEEL